MKGVPMRIQRKQRWICCALAVILLMSGMCVDIKPADSYLCCDTNVSTGTILEVPRYLLSVREVCTPEMLRQGIALPQNQNYRRILIRRFSRIGMGVIVAEGILPRLLLSARVTEAVYGQPAAFHVVIVQYIQQQDGKK